MTDNVHQYKILSTPPAQPIISLTDTKAFLRIDSTYTDEDTIIGDFVNEAVVAFEEYTNRTLTATQFQTYRNSWASTHLRKNPFVSIDSIQYYDWNNVLQTLDPANYYCVDEPEYYNKLIFNGNRPTLAAREQSIIIKFTAGYESPTSSMKIAILNYVTYLYENRGDIARGTPDNIRSLWDKYTIQQI